MSSDLRSLQLTELEILKEIKNLCDRHNLEYFLSGGTCLGAVRHGGFIPWDDDVDVMMPYSSYTRFIDLAKKELDGRFFVQTHLTDLHDQQSFAKIRMNNTAMIMPNHKRQKIHQGIWVDIFPLIYVKNEKDMKTRKIVMSVSNFLQMDTYLLDNEKEFSELLGGAYYPFRLFLKVPLRIRAAIHSALLKFAYRKSNGGFFTEAWGTMTHMYKRLLLSGELTELNFEGEKFRVLPGYREYLENTYGDYMQLPPVEQRKGHGNLIIDTERSYLELLD